MEDEIFASVYVSKLAKNARKNVKDLYQVDLMTTEQYAEYLKKNSDYKGKYILCIREKLSVKIKARLSTGFYFYRQ